MLNYLVSRENTCFAYLYSIFKIIAEKFGKGQFSAVYLIYQTNTMKLTKEQIKIAKAACKASGIDTKLVTGEVGNGCWSEKCGGTFEGYIAYLTTPHVSDNSTLKMLLQGKNDYANGIYGASKFRR